MTFCVVHGIWIDVSPPLSLYQEGLTSAKVIWQFALWIPGSWRVKKMKWWRQHDFSSTVLPDVFNLRWPTWSYLVWWRRSYRRVASPATRLPTILIGWHTYRHFKLALLSPNMALCVGDILYKSASWPRRLLNMALYVALSRNIARNTYRHLDGCHFFQRGDSPIFTCIKQTKTMFEILQHHQK